MTSHRIIVGVDGSPGAQAAVRWAADECRVRGCSLLVLHSLNSHDTYPVAGEPAVRGYYVAAEQLLTRYASVASVRQPGVPVTTLFTREAPAETLIDLSASAVMIVVGTRGANAFTSTMLGSVSTCTATHALCPVAVVPEHLPAAGGDRIVVVGKSDGPAGLLAMRFATEETRIHGATLRAVHAEADPAEALLLAAQDAQLLVLGCHHSEDRWSTRLGSVPTAVLHRCPCPVVVVGAAHPNSPDTDELISAAELSAR
ncbi:MAG: universal stress protein [Jatrophihabitans sp.]